MASSGMASGKVTRATCGESIREQVKCANRRSRCRAAWLSRGSSQLAAITPRRRRPEREGGSGPPARVTLRGENRGGGGGGIHDNPQGGEARRVAQGTEEALGEGEGVHPTARSVEPGAPRTAVGARRRALHLRGRAREANTQRALRWTQPTCHLSRDVQPRNRWGSYDLDGGRAVLRLFVLDGQLQQHHHPPEPPGHHDGRNLTRSLPEAGRLQETDGLGVSVAVIARKRLQLRLSRLVHKR